MKKYCSKCKKQTEHESVKILCYAREHICRVCGTVNGGLDDRM